MVERGSNYQPEDDFSSESERIVEGYTEAEFNEVLRRLAGFTLQYAYPDKPFDPSQENPQPPYDELTNKLNLELKSSHGTPTDINTISELFARDAKVRHGFFGQRNKYHIWEINHDPTFINPRDRRRVEKGANLIEDSLVSFVIGQELKSVSRSEPFMIMRKCSMYAITHIPYTVRRRTKFDDTPHVAFYTNFYAVKETQRHISEIDSKSHETWQNIARSSIRHPYRGGGFSPR